MGTFCTQISDRIHDELKKMYALDDQGFREQHAACCLRETRNRYARVESPSSEVIRNLEPLQSMVFGGGEIGVHLFCTRGQDGQCQNAYLFRDCVGGYEMRLEAPDKIEARGVVEVLMEFPGYPYLISGRENEFLQCREYSRSKLAGFHARDVNPENYELDTIQENVRRLVDTHLGERFPNPNRRSAFLTLDRESGRIVDMKSLPKNDEAFSEVAVVRVEVSTDRFPQYDFIRAAHFPVSGMSGKASRVIRHSLNIGNALGNSIDLLDCEQHVLGNRSHYRLDLPSRMTKRRDEAFFEERLKQFEDVRLKGGIRTPLLEVHEPNSMESSSGPMITFRLQPAGVDFDFKKLKRLIGEISSCTSLDFSRDHAHGLQQPDLFHWSVDGGKNLRELILDIAQTVGVQKEEEWDERFSRLRVSNNFPADWGNPATISILGNPETKEIFRDFRARFFDTPWDLEKIVDVW